MPNELNAIEFGLPCNGIDPIGDMLNQACAKAYADGHSRVFIPRGVYRMTQPFDIDYPVHIYGVGDDSLFLCDWQRQYESAIRFTGLRGGCGSFSRVHVGAKQGTSGGNAIELYASAVDGQGAHWNKLNDLRVSGLGAAAEWNWCIIVNGVDNQNPATGVRVSSINDCLLNNPRYGYIYCANARRFWIRGGCFHGPVPGSNALGLQPNTTDPAHPLPGVAVLFGSNEVYLSPDVDIG